MYTIDLIQKSSTKYDSTCNNLVIGPALSLEFDHNILKCVG